MERDTHTHIGAKIWWFELTTLINNGIAYHKFDPVGIKIKENKRKSEKEAKSFRGIVQSPG